MISFIQIPNPKSPNGNASFLFFLFAPMSDPELLNPVMVPPVVNESTFTEFWPFSVNYDVRLPLNSGQDFRYSGNSYISGAEESTVTEQTGGGRKRRALTSQDESSKMMFSSCTSVNRLVSFISHFFS